MKEPPLCPVCGKELLLVNSVSRSVWLYDGGHYDNVDDVETTLNCPFCGACLDEVFRMGIYS